MCFIRRYLFFVVLWLGCPVRTTLAVDILDREAVVAFYERHFLSTDDSQTGWLGDVASGDASEVSSRHLEAMADRINGFRGLAGVSESVRLEASLNRRAQAAALLISANHKVSHRPPETWTHYSDEGASGAANSNLTLGVFGVEALDAYMRDAGSGNEDVGHRRWLLRPGVPTMGVGDIPPSRGFSAANAVWVTSSASGDTSTRDGFIAWPPPGYCPKPMVYPRWSFSLPGADFSDASIDVSDASGAVDVSIVGRTNERPMATIVWEMEAGFLAGNWRERTWRVRIGDVGIRGEPTDFEYEVIGLNIEKEPLESAPAVDWSMELRSQSSPVITGDGALALAVGSDLMVKDIRAGADRWIEPVSANASPPTVSPQGVIYVGVKAWPGGVRALDERDGTLLWNAETPGRVLGAPKWDSDSGLIFFGAELRLEDNALRTDGHFHAIRSDSGQIEWKVDLAANVSASAVVDATRVFVGTGFRQDASGMTLDGRAIALDKGAGDLIWQFEGNGSFCVDPVLGPDNLVIFASSASTVYALDRESGREVWRFHARGALNEGGPVLGEGGDVWIGDSEGVIYRLDGLTGAKRWAYDSGASIGAAPLVRRDGVTFWGNREGNLIALSGAGELLWRHRLTGAGSYTPVLAPDGALIVATEKRADQDPTGEWIREPGSLTRFALASDGTVGGETPDNDEQNKTPPGTDSSESEPVLTLSRCVLGEAVDLVVHGAPNIRVQVEVSGDLAVWKTTEVTLDENGVAALSFDIQNGGPGARFFRAKAFP